MTLCKFLPTRDGFSLPEHPGLTSEGSLPETFELQAEQAWKNILSALHKAGMGPEHLVKLVQYLVRTEDLPAYGTNAATPGSYTEVEIPKSQR